MPQAPDVFDHFGAVDIDRSGSIVDRVDGYRNSCLIDKASVADHPIGELIDAVEIFIRRVKDGAVTLDHCGSRNRLDRDPTERFSGRKPGTGRSIIGQHGDRHGVVFVDVCKVVGKPVIQPVSCKS